MEIENIIPELTFKAVRSSGAGGQNVNKVASKVVLFFDLENSHALDWEQKERLKQKLSTRLSNDNVLILNCEEDRSQLKNKYLVIKKFLTIIKQALEIAKPRKISKIPRSAIERRLKSKRTAAIIKYNRKKPDF